jgi:hypothetical protein
MSEDWKIFWMFVGAGLGWYVGALLSVYLEFIRGNKHED